MKPSVLSHAFRFVRPLGVAILLAALAAALGLPPSGAAEAKPIPNAVSPGGGPLVAPGPAPDIILLYTGRAVGYVEPCG